MIILDKHITRNKHLKIRKTDFEFVSLFFSEAVYKTALKNKNLIYWLQLYLLLKCIDPLL